MGWTGSVRRTSSLRWTRSFGRTRSVGRPSSWRRTGVGRRPSGRGDGFGRPVRPCLDRRSVRGRALGGTGVLRLADAVIPSRRPGPLRAVSVRSGRGPTLIGRPGAHRRPWYGRGGAGRRRPGRRWRLARTSGASSGWCLSCAGRLGWRRRRAGTRRRRTYDHPTEAGGAHGLAQVRLGHVDAALAHDHVDDLHVATGRGEHQGPLADETGEQLQREALPGLDAADPDDGAVARRHQHRGVGRDVQRPRRGERGEQQERGRDAPHGVLSVAWTAFRARPCATYLTRALRGLERSPRRLQTGPRPQPMPARLAHWLTTPPPGRRRPR